MQSSETETERRWKMFGHKVQNDGIIDTRLFLDEHHGAAWMKYRLQWDYPLTLKINSSKSIRVSELVTRHDAQLAELVEDDNDIVTPRQNLSLSATTSSAEEDSRASENFQSSDFSARPALDLESELFHSALALMAAIKKSHVTIRHPPTTSDLSVNNAREPVPPELFKFWVFNEDIISTNWLEGDYAPKEILKTTKCGCKAVCCKGARCACHKAGLRCTALRSCKDCSDTNIGQRWPGRQ